MRRRRGNTSIAANPVLIGAATTLVVIVAVFLAYNANSGPAVHPDLRHQRRGPERRRPRQGQRRADGRNARRRGDEITPVAHPTATITGVLDLKLEKLVEPLPTDSTVIVRPRSAVGLKYVQLTKGTGSTELKNGGSLPLSQAKPIPVELDQFFDMFDEETRRGAQGSLQAFGDAFAGRGVDINYAIQDLNPFARQGDAGVPQPGEPADRPARILRRARARGRRDRARRRGRRPSCSATSTSRSARSRDVAYPYIQDSISEGPETLDAATESLPKIEAAARQLGRALHRRSSRASTRSRTPRRTWRA